MTDDKGASEPFSKAIRKGVLIAQDLEPGMSIMVGGYVFTGKYTTWADQINRALDERVKAEREITLKLLVYAQHLDSCGDMSAYNKDEAPSCNCGLGELKDAIRGGQDAK